MKDNWRTSNRAMQIQKYVIYEMTRLSKEVENVVSLSRSKPISNTPENIKKAASSLIRKEYK